jgi:aspartate aminotransferase-like enzyme
MSQHMAFGTFFLPGPTEVHPDVLAAMTRPMIPHRGREFEELFARLQAGLREVFRTDRPVYVSSSSATGLMEASLRCLPRGRVLSLVNGAFSDRYARIARACGHAVDLYEVPPGSTFDPLDVEQRLDTAGAEGYAAITIVHSETSTGVLSDVQAIAAIAERHGVLTLVDGVTSVAATAIMPDEWKLDFLLTGSQKALALPPGLAFGVASERYLAGVADAADRGVYLDVLEFEHFSRKNQTPNTPAISLLHALDAQLDRVRTEGIDARWRRHAQMAEATHRWVDEVRQQRGIDIGILAPVGARSPTVTAVTLPPALKGGEVVAAVRRRGFVIGGGYGPLGDTSIRIGHMGDHTARTLGRCLVAIEESIAEVAAV